MAEERVAAAEIVLDPDGCFELDRLRSRVKG
jgi:hypothetical protein